MIHPEGMINHRVCEECWQSNFGTRPQRSMFIFAECCLCGAQRNLDIEVILTSDIELMCDAR